MGIMGDTAGIARRGLASVAWGVGRFAGIIARALRIRRRPARHDRRQPPERCVLLNEIAGLEADLDQAYYLVARGDGGLTALLSRVRDLKEKLRRARSRLKRSDRDAAMSRRFLRILFSGAGSPGDGNTTPPIWRPGYDEEEGEYEFESLLDEDP